MRYFDNQKYDEAGIIGVRLQKILLFLMIFHLSSLLWGVGMANLVGTICMITLLFIGFKGASKRNPKLLRGFCLGSVVYFLATLVFVVVGVAFFMFYRPQMSYGDDSIYPLLTLNPTQANETDPVMPVDAVTQDPSSPEDATVMMDLVPANSNNDTNIPIDFEVQPEFCWWGIIFMGLGLLLGLLVFAFHISAIVLSHRMSKILIATAAQNLAHPKKQSAEPQVVMPQAPAMVVPVQVQPNNFGYYPMYTMNPGNVQNGQQFYFNPYLQPAQYYPQVNAQGNAQV